MNNYFIAKTILKVRGFGKTGTIILDGEININVCIPIETDEPIMEKPSDAQWLYEQDARETINLNSYRLLNQLDDIFKYYYPLVGIVVIQGMSISEVIPDDAVVWNYEEQAIRELSDELGVRLISHYFQEMEEMYFDDDEQ